MQTLRLTHRLDLRLIGDSDGYREAGVGVEVRSESKLYFSLNSATPITAAMFP